MNAIVFETKWQIWKNRNNVKFGKLSKSAVSIHKIIKQNVFEYISSNRYETLIKLFDIYFKEEHTKHMSVKPP
jgi:hypothetical protein